MIQAWVDARSLGPKGSGFMVVMRDEKHKWARSMGCGKITSNQAEVKGLEYVLASIDSDFYRDKVIIRVNGRYGPMMLEKDSEGKWSKNSIKHAGLVEKIREYASKFSDLEVSYFPNDNIFGQLRDINEQAINSGEHIFTKK